METVSLHQFIKKASEYYDNQKYNYINLISNQNVKINEATSEIMFMFETEKPYYGEYEILGYFDNQTNIWIWGWLLGDLSSSHTNLCRELLNYGLKLEPRSNSEEHFMIKSLLVNSRISLEEDVQLDINLAIYSYLIRDKIAFIYPRKRYIDDTNKKYVTFYYLIKKKLSDVF